MSEEISQQTAPTEADTSLQQGNNAPVADVAPANKPSQQTTPQPSQATTGEPSAQAPEAGGGAGGDVVTTAQQPQDPLADYAASKAQFLRGEPQAQQPDPPPAEPQQHQQQAPAEPDRLPKMPIRPADTQDQQLLSDWKQHGQGKTLREFILEKMAPPPPPAKQADGGEPPPALTLPDGSEVKTAFQSVEEVDAEIERLINARYDALDNFDPKTAREYELRQKALERQRMELAGLEQFVQSVEQTAFVATWNDSLAKAQSIFPEAGRPGSALEAKAAEIRQQWVDSNHPLAHSPDSAVALYAEAAAALGQPAASAAPPVVTTSPPSIHRPPAQIIAGGDARTNPNRAPVEVTAENYAQLKAQILGRGRAA